MISDRTVPAPLSARLEDHRVGDGAFARAYTRLGDAGRAHIKQAIARLYALNEAERRPPSVRVSTFAGALVHEIRTRPNAWFALALDPAAASPALLLAALMPAMVRRTANVAVLRPRSRIAWPEAQLTALELCGVENVYGPTKKDFPSLLEAFLETGEPGCLACLGGAGFFRRVQEGLGGAGRARVHWFDAEPRLGLWAGGETGWDMDALRLAHPGAAILAFGGEAPGCEAVGGGLAALNAAGLDAAFVPPETGPVAAPLALSPGMELFWRFPHAGPDLYETRSETFQPDPV